MQLAQSKEQLQKMQQQIQMLEMTIKQRQDIEQVKQDAETKRELMRVTAKAHDTEMRDTSKQTDTVINNQTKIEIERMKAQLALVLANMNLSAEKQAEVEAIERAI
jgi:multidrug resistance efflux pump